jgi:hypothetical protein
MEQRKGEEVSWVGARGVGGGVELVVERRQRSLSEDLEAGSAREQASP